MFADPERKPSPAYDGIAIQKLVELPPGMEEVLKYAKLEDGIRAKSFSLDC